VAGDRRTTGKGSVPAATLDLVRLRASQIKGYSSCVNWGSQAAKMAGQADERLFTVAAWRKAPYFTDAEPAALALTEAVTRLTTGPTRSMTDSGGAYSLGGSGGPARAQSARDKAREPPFRVAV
jgi:AhpD family alkylhydroperoxidase